MIILVKVAGIIFKTKIVNLAIITPTIKPLLITFANKPIAPKSVNWCSSREAADKTSDSSVAVASLNRLYI